MGSTKSLHVRVGLAAVFASAVAARVPAEGPTRDVGILVDAERFAERCQELRKRIDAAPAAVMKGPGLAGAMGGAHVRVVDPFPQDVMLPMPQVANGQVPITFFIRSEPADAVSEYRLWNRGDGNVVVRVRLAGKIQDVRLDWASVVLLSTAKVGWGVKGSRVFEKASGCAQAEAKEIKNLAADLWPAPGKATEFAANIQKHIAGMKPTAPPRSLDALGILKSGQNGICTGNANLAVALMRSQGIACRSVAVIPPNGMRLEMHRVVEFYDGGGWQAFDPSSLTRNVPSHRWQNIVMATTSFEDEEAAMKPRMGVMVGCPFGQEIELLTPGVMLFGQDFFCTTAKPVAEFVPRDESMRTARGAWEAFVKSGSLRREQIDAAAAATAEEFAKRIKSP